MLLAGIAATLNDLPREVNLELQPPEVILDAAHSSDKKKVLATCDVNPEVPDGPFCYFQVPAGNANFRRLRVRPGDIVRYYASYDQESLEHGYQEQTYFELVVRRLDTKNPNNGLIVEGGLSAATAYPERLEIWRYSDKRTDEIRNRLALYAKLRRPPVAWEPSPDEGALLQLVERTNQWVRGQLAKGGRRKAEGGIPNSRQPDSLIATLPKLLQEELVVAAAIGSDKLQYAPFAESEGRLLQQAIWLRDISQWAKGDALADLEIARALFDWTIGNVQLDPSDTETIVFHPWQALLYGHGTAEQRAWVFAELCRQQHLDVVMLAIGSNKEEAENLEDSSQWWLPALWSEGKLYLFDTTLGIPVPGPDGESVATLAEVIAAPQLLRQLDMEPALIYPIDAKALSQVEAHLIASPLQLSHRAALLEQVLEGGQSVVLAANNRRLAEELQKKEFENLEHRLAVKLWDGPFRALVGEQTIRPSARQQAALRFAVLAYRPRLWKARVLHFQGFKPVPPEQSDDPLAEPRRGHRDALRLYQDRRVRPSEDRLRGLQPAKQLIYRTAKGDASYWLGLLCFDLGKTNSAIHWLKDRTLEATPQGPWAAGARLNLARIYQQQGELDKAIKLLETDQSPQRHGNLLRARRLRSE